MAAQSLTPPPYQAQVQDTSGYFTKPWSEWFRQIFSHDIAVVFHGTCTGRTPLGLGSTTAFNLTSILDPVGGFTGGNSYTIKVPGVYSIDAWLDGGFGGPIGSAGVNAVFGGNILINSVIVATFNIRNQVAGNFSSWGVTPSTVADLSTGDVVSINAVTNFTTPGSGTEGRLNIMRVGS